MSQKFYTLITQQGAALLANATALGVPLKLTKMAVGDGNGSATTPNASQTSLIHEVYQAPLNSLTTDEKNPNQIIAELVIPENQGGWFIHEIGLYDENNTLIAVGNCPATYKPQLSEGSGRTQVIRMIIIVDNVDCVALKIDPSVVLATRKYVDDLLSTTMQNHKAHTQQELQKELNKLVPKITQINGYELKSNVNLTANDINALPAIKKMQAGVPTYEVGNFLNFLKEVNFYVLPTFKKQNMLGNGFLSQNGYAQIPLSIEGTIKFLIVQWGSSVAYGPRYFTYPISFPNNYLCSFATSNDVGGSFVSVDTAKIANLKTQIHLSPYSVSGVVISERVVAINWLSIGY